MKMAAKLPTRPALLLFLLGCISVLVSPCVAQQSFNDIQCEAEFARLDQKIDYTTYYSGVTPICSTVGSQVSCTEDFSGPSSQIKPICTADGGKFYTIQDSVTCDLYKNGASYTVTISLMNYGLCAGSSCSQSYLELAAKGLAANETSGLTTAGFTNCVASVNSASFSSAQATSSSTSYATSAGTRPIAYMTVTALAIVGQQLVMMIASLRI